VNTPHGGQIIHRFSKKQTLLARPERTSNPQPHIPAMLVSIVILAPVKKSALININNALLLNLYLGDYVGGSRAEKRNTS